MAPFTRDASFEVLSHHVVVICCFRSGSSDSLFDTSTFLLKTAPSPCVVSTIPCYNPLSPLERCSGPCRL